MFLEHPVEALRALVLEGEPGIGKSTIWAAALDSARARNFRVLASRPTEAERDLAYVVLGDLFEGVLDEVLPVLTVPRRRALQAALLADQTPGQPVNPRALGVAVRTSLAALADRGPLIVAIDDEQWLDASSATALRFALRRLREARVLLLLARRTDQEADTPGLEAALDSNIVARLTVGPLSMGALHHLLKRRLDRTFTRPALLRLLELSAGNPFYALELARSQEPARATGDPMEAFAIPESLERLVVKRLERLAAPARSALLLVAAHGRPSPALLRDAGQSESALDAALDANVVEYSDGAIRFTHPLLASVLYRNASREDRRAAHAKLANATSDPIDRARHLALVARDPDAETATELEEAAGLARNRGAILTAAELGDHALRLTPPEALEDTHRRAVAAARACLEAGEVNRAISLASNLLARAQAGTPRAEALVLMSDIEGAPNLERGIELRRQALAAASGAPRLEAEIHLWLGDALRFTEGVGAGERHTRAALTLAEGLGDADLRATALALLASSRFRAGESDALQLVETAVRYAAEATEPGVRMEAVLHLALPLVWSFQLDRATELLEAAQREWGDRDESTSAGVFWYLGMVEFRAGRFGPAADHAEHAREIGRQYALDEREDPSVVWLVALLAAHRGELGEARALAELVGALAENRPPIRAGKDEVLGLIALWTGDPVEAAARFEAADAARRGSGVGEPALFWWHADRVEALLALGEFDEAVALVRAWEADATRLGRTVVLAHAARCRGLLAARKGDLGQAMYELERAIPLHESVGDAFGRARTSLALGIVRRRARQKRAARQAIEAALEGFEQAGAAGWAEKARAELGRIGGRSREEGLTAAERRVATLVAKGRTNREVAAALFLGERTVETHLSHVYAKLGIRSRTELVRRLAKPSEAAEQSSGESTISS